MRVLAVGNIYPPHDLGGGYELTWRSSMLALRDRGNDVRVLTSAYRAPDLPPTEELDPGVHRELRLYWEQHAFPRRGIRSRWQIERHNGATLARHMAEFKPDVVNWWGMGGLSMSLVERVRREGLPAVGVVGDEWLVWGPKADAWARPFRRRPRLARLVEWITGLPTRPDIGAGATWLFNSEFVRGKTASAGVSLPHSAIAHPGIEVELFGPAEPPAPWAWRLLYLGRLDSRKGVQTVIEAMPLLPVETTLVLQGSGDEEYVGSLRELVGRLGLENRVTFSQAPRGQLREVYAACDAVVFPVVWDEPWGLVPLEAMAVGCPVVATGTGGSAEYLQHETNCLLFSPTTSAQALSDAVTRLAYDEALRERIRAEGQRTAARYTEQAYNEAIAAALRSAADGAAG